MTKIYCDVASIEAMSTGAIYRVRLIPQIPCSFRAGQYLMLVVHDTCQRAFSIASTPMEIDNIELHIGTSDSDVFSKEIINFIHDNKIITIDIPYGKAWLRDDSKRPIVLIAGGTGFSYIRSILLTALKKNYQGNIILYWGVREFIHFYDLDMLNILTTTYPKLKVILVVEKPLLNWQGRRGTILDAVIKDFPSLINYDIYIAGRFEMVKIARERFCTECSASKSHIYSDAL